MSEQLRIEKRVSPDGTVLRVSGDIESTFQAANLVDGLTGDVAVIDLDGVKRVTSFGVREWLAALSRLTTSFYCFTKVRPAMVAQLNMVAGFAGRGVLVSMYLPYICEECDTETEVLTDLRTDFDVVTRGTPPAVTCPGCDSDAVFDDVPASYFIYASQNRPPPLPAAAARLIDGKEAPASESLTVQKEVAGKVTGVWLMGAVTKKARFKRLLDGIEGATVVVMQGVSAVEPTAIVRMQELLSFEGVALLLARVPLDVLEGVREQLRLGLAGRLLSLSLPGTCPSCGVVTFEVRGEAVDVATTRDELPCPSCHTHVRVPGVGARIAGTTSLFAHRVPGEVLTYLSARPGASLPGIAAADVRTGSDLTRDIPPEQKYEIIQKLGTGGMAEVYLARQRGPQGFVKRVALKTVIGSLARNKQFTEMFLQEARVAAAITHPNVVQIFDLGQDGDRYFIAMEYVHGWDLRRVLTAAKRQSTSLPVELAARITADVAAGLHAAHTCIDEEGRPLGIVHRDVSPHNVLLSDEGGVKIADFGVSKVVDSMFETRSGQIKGKVMYMAPEQVNPKLGEINARTDVFALGLLLHEMLVGFPIFHRQSELDSIGAVLKAEIPRVSEYRDDVPDALCDVVVKAVQREQSERFSTAASFHMALHAALLSMSRPATPAHLSEWLLGIAAAAEASGEMKNPSVTPTGVGTSDGTLVVKRKTSTDEVDDSATVILNPDELDTD